MKTLSHGFFLLIFILLMPSFAFSQGSKVFNKNGRKCGALGVTDLGEYLSRENVKCFRSKRRAETKGYVSAEFGILSQEVQPMLIEFALSGVNAVPPASTNATGSCTAVLNAARDNLRVVCVHNASTADKAHIHLGKAGEKGPKICVANAPESPIAWDCPMNSSLVDALLSGELYVNIHSTEFVPGELRAQIQ